MAFGHRTYLDCAAIWRRWKMHPTWVPGVYSRFVPRKAWVCRLNKFLGVFHFPWNSGFARLCGLRDVHVLSDADEPRRGLPHEEVGGRVQALPPGCDCKVAPNCAGSIDKTKAFEFVLDFAPSNAPEAIRQLYGLIADNLPAYKAMGPAKRYEHLAGPMASTRASPVARSRICWAITLAAAVFHFYRRTVGASAFHGVIGAFVVSLQASFRLRLVSVLPRA